MNERFTDDPRADLLNELARVEKALRTATLNRCQLLTKREQLLAQLAQMARASWATNEP